MRFFFFFFPLVGWEDPRAPVVCMKPCTAKKLAYHCVIDPTLFHIVASFPLKPCTLCTLWPRFP